MHVLEPASKRPSNTQGVDLTPGLAMARLVASCFAEALRSDLFRDRFERVVFAIAYDDALLSEFQNSFEQHFKSADS